jgi:hypothetical protein
VEQDLLRVEEERDAERQSVGVAEEQHPVVIEQRKIAIEKGHQIPLAQLPRPLLVVFVFAFVLVFVFVFVAFVDSEFVGEGGGEGRGEDVLLEAGREDLGDPGGRQALGRRREAAPFLHPLLHILERLCAPVCVCVCGGACATNIRNTTAHTAHNAHDRTPHNRARGKEAEGVPVVNLVEAGSDEARTSKRDLLSCQKAFCGSSASSPGARAGPAAAPFASCPAANLVTVGRGLLLIIIINNLKH